MPRDYRCLSARPIRRFLRPSFAVTPPPAAAARLDSAALPLPEKKPAKRAAPARADRPFRGIALILASTVFLGISDVTAKYLSATLALDRDRLDQVSGVRADHGAGDAAGVAAVCAATRAARFAGDARHRATVRLRCSSSRACGFSRSRKPPPPVSSRRCSSPRCRSSFSASGSAPRRWIATAVGLVGVLIILRPGTGAFHPAAFFPIVSALAWACTLIMTRMMSGREHALTTMTYSSIVGVCVFSALVPFAGSRRAGTIFCSGF